MIIAPVTFISNAVYEPRKGQIPEDPWVITWHAMWARKIFKIYFELYGAV